MRPHTARMRGRPRALCGLDVFAPLFTRPAEVSRPFDNADVQAGRAIIEAPDTSAPIRTRTSPQLYCRTARPAVPTSTGRAGCGGGGPACGERGGRRGMRHGLSSDVTRFDQDDGMTISLNRRGPKPRRVRGASAAGGRAERFVVANGGLGGCTTRCPSGWGETFTLGGKNCQGGRPDFFRSSGSSPRQSDSSPSSLGDVRR